MPDRVLFPRGTNPDSDFVCRFLSTKTSATLPDTLTVTKAEMLQIAWRVRSWSLAGTLQFKYDPFNIPAGAGPFHTVIISVSMPAIDWYITPPGFFPFTPSGGGTPPTLPNPWINNIVKLPSEKYLIDASYIPDLTKIPSSARANGGLTMAGMDYVQYNYLTIPGPQTLRWTRSGILSQMYSDGIWFRNFPASTGDPNITNDTGTLITATDNGVDISFYEYNIIAFNMLNPWASTLLQEGYVFKTDTKRFDPAANLQGHINDGGNHGYQFYPHYPDLNYTGTAPHGLGTLHILGSTIELQWIQTGFNNVVPGSVTLDFTLTPTSYWAYENSQGQPVYDTASGAQLVDPFS
jgi:hypothetical protein